MKKCFKTRFGFFFSSVIIEQGRGSIIEVRYVPQNRVIFFLFLLFVVFLGFFALQCLVLVARSHLFANVEMGEA